MDSPAQAPDPTATGGVAVGRRPESADDEAELVERAARDPEAFSLLYRRHVEPVYRFAYRRSGSREVADDVTSATFEKALRSIDRFEWKRGGFRAWLYRIASNELTDHHRRVQRENAPTGQRALRLLAAEPVDPPEEMTEPDADRRLQGALNRINPRYQEALSLRYLAGLTPEETAAALGCSRTTLAVVLHRAGRALRRQLLAVGEGRE